MRAGAPDAIAILDQLGPDALDRDDRAPMLGAAIAPFFGEKSEDSAEYDEDDVAEDAGDATGGGVVGSQRWACVPRVASVVDRERIGQLRSTRQLEVVTDRGFSASQQ